MHRASLIPRLALVACALSLTAAPLAAQACLGAPSFADAGLRLAGGASFIEGAQGWSAGLAGGKHQGAFLGAGYQQVTYDDFEGTSNVGYFELGYQFPLGGRMQLCPVAGGSFSSGPDAVSIEGSEVSFTSQFGSGGLALGIPFAAGRSLGIIPNVAVKYEYARSTSEETGAGETSVVDHSGLVDVGLGFVIARRFGIQPTVQIPFAADTDDVSWGVLVTIGFGRGSR